MSDLYIGLISGTSMDGIDAALVEIDERRLRLLHTHTYRYPAELQTKLRAAMLQPASCGVDQLGELHIEVGACFRDAALQLLSSSGTSHEKIRAIGSHGQTLRHRPDAKHRFTLQIGDPATIATGTGVDTVADFRSSDVALGGEGAPLVPPFHDWMFRDDKEHRVVLNIGGIANITVLPAESGPVSGFDTGPGNTLLDAWSRHIRELPYDEDGQWAASGRVDEALVERMLQDEWFAAPPPKSTGFECFNLDWLQGFAIASLPAEDVQASLAELSARSIATAIQEWAPGTASVHVCGGGIRNSDLLARLTRALAPASVHSTEESGLDPDWVEACAFAWLASRRLDNLPGNSPMVTGARRDAILGAIYSH